jgi:hypothetical protein
MSNSKALATQGLLIQKPSQRKVCISGISENFSVSEPGSTFNALPSTMDLKKARRIASKPNPTASTFSACANCKRIKRKCGDLRPCDRCVATGKSADCAQNESSAQIERPISFGVAAVNFTFDHPWPGSVQLRHQWSSQTIRAFWSMGYSLSSLRKLFDAIPPPMAASMEKMFATLHSLMTLKAPPSAG